MKKKMDHKILNKMLVEAENRPTHSRISIFEKIQKIKVDTLKIQIYKKCQKLGYMSEKSKNQSLSISL